MYLGSWDIDDLLTFPANTHAPSTGAATDADAVPSYRVYEDETGTAILTGSMAKLDDANTTGFYSEQLTLSAANGFERGKTYTIYISAAVGSVAGTISHTFQVGAEVNVAYIEGADPTDQIKAAADTAIAEAALATASGLATAQNDLDIITGSDGATLAASQPNYAPAKATDVVSGGAITTSGGAVSTVTGVTNQVSANVTAISGDSTAADNLEEAATAVVLAAVNDGAATTTSFVTTLAGAVDDYYNGKILTFTSGALIGQSTDITDYVGASKTVTVTALTGAPANSVTFVVT